MEFTLRALAAKALPALKANQPIYNSKCVRKRRRKDSVCLHTKPHQCQAEKDKRDVMRGIDIVIIIPPFPKHHGIGDCCQSTGTMDSDSSNQWNEKE
jgi:hypothetical protein